jgi:glycosyltransferase involved in cell wall biosynthesis
MTPGASGGATCLVLTYDRLPMLRAAVGSALAQDAEDVEVLVIANGSPPATLEWLASVDHPRLRVLALPDNINPTAARNAGIRAATRPWVGFLDDDDLWAPDKVSRMLAAAEDAGRDWVYCGCAYVDADDVVVGGRPAPGVPDVERRLPVAYLIPGGLSGLMWNAAAVGAVLDERMTYCDDWDLALQLLRWGPPAAVDAPLVGFRQHGGAWSRGVGPLFAEYRLIAEKHADLRLGRDVARSEHARYAAGQALRAGDRHEAARYYLRAITQGDLWSVPRLLGVALPRRLQQWLRDRLLSDRRVMAAAQRWVDAVEPPSARPAGA